MNFAAVNINIHALGKVVLRDLNKQTVYKFNGAQKIVLVVPVAVGMDSLLQPLPNYNAATIAASTYQVYAGEKIVMTVPNQWEVAYAFFPNSVSLSGPPAQLTLTTSEGATSATNTSAPAGGATMTGPATIEGAHGFSTTTSGGALGSSTAGNETLAVDGSTAVESETLAGNGPDAANDPSMAEESSSGATSSPATAGGAATLHCNMYNTTILGRQPEPVHHQHVEVFWTQP